MTYNSWGSKTILRCGQAASLLCERVLFLFLNISFVQAKAIYNIFKHICWCFLSLLLCCMTILISTVGFYQAEITARVLGNASFQYFIKKALPLCMSVLFLWQLYLDNISITTLWQVAWKGATLMMPALTKLSTRSSHIKKPKCSELKKVFAVLCLKAAVFTLSSLGTMEKRVIWTPISCRCQYSQYHCRIAIGSNAQTKAMSRPVTTC